MLFERIVFSLLCLGLLAYVVHIFIKTRNNMVLAMIAFQIIACIVNILSLLNGIFPSTIVQIYICVMGVIAPITLFALEYFEIDMIKLIDIKIGDRYMKEGEYDKAIARFKDALSRDSTDGTIFSRLGNAYNAIGDRRTAFDRFAKAVELNRNDYKSYYEIGIIFNELGKKNDAKVVLDNALRIKPDYTQASELLAVVLCALNKYDEAINVYKDAIKYSPDNYQLYYSMGIVRTELRDFNEAKECYERAIELKPDLYEAFFSLGQIHLLKGELLEAERMFKRSLYDKDLAGKSYYQLAKVYILNDEEIKAVTYLEYAIEIDATYRYKAESEPLFKKIKDYLTGIHMVSQAQMKLEREINEKVNEKYSNSEYRQIEIGEDSFNYMDKYSGKK